MFGDAFTVSEVIFLRLCPISYHFLSFHCFTQSLNLGCLVSRALKLRHKQPPHSARGKTSGGHAQQMVSSEWFLRKHLGKESFSVSSSQRVLREFLCAGQALCVARQLRRAGYSVDVRRGLVPRSRFQGLLGRDKEGPQGLQVCRPGECDACGLRCPWRVGARRQCFNASHLLCLM